MTLQLPTTGTLGALVDAYGFNIRVRRADWALNWYFEVYGIADHFNTGSRVYEGYTNRLRPGQRIRECWGTEGDQIGWVFVERVEPLDLA